MFREILPGSVLVLATNQHRISGPWGENTSLSARKRGGRGIVIDGGTRDVNEITAFGFPTFCRFVTPVYSGGRFVQTALQVPVEVAGQVDEKVVVEPEDFIVADADGVVVVPKALLEEVLLAAERLDEIEHQIRAALHLGEDREEVYRRYPKFDHVHKPGL
jgi:regulator of RNase E activity RraA